MAQAHKRPELALFLVVNKELFCQCRLVIQHINQKAQRAQVVTQLIESAGCPGLTLVNFGNQHFFDAVAHAQHGLRSLLQPKNRQDTSHLRQLAWYVAKHGLVQGVTEKHV